MNSSPEAKIELRQRSRSDLPRLLDIITAVHAETGYPVDGPFCFEAFLDPPPDQLLHAITAVLTPAAADQQQDADGEQQHPIAGHAMIMSPSAGAGAGGVLNPASRAHLERGGTMEDHAVLSRFFVDPAAQARGVGSVLLQEATAWAGREGRRLVLVVLEKDDGAVRLYDRAGWVRVGEHVFTSCWGTGYNAMAYLGPAVSQVSGC